MPSTKELDNFNPFVKEKRTANRVNIFEFNISKKIFETLIRT